MYNFELDIGKYFQTDCFRARQHDGATIGCKKEVSMKMRPSEAPAFAGRLNEMLEKSGVPVRGRAVELSKITGISHAGTTKWLKGEGFPSLDNAILLGKHYRKNVEWLLLGVGPQEVFDPNTDELRLLRSYRSSNPQGKTTILRVAEIQTEYRP